MRVGPGIGRCLGLFKDTPQLELLRVEPHLVLSLTPYLERGDIQQDLHYAAHSLKSCPPTNSYTPPLLSFPSHSRKYSRDSMMPTADGLSRKTRSRSAQPSLIRAPMGPKVVVLATGWGPKYGGVNAFNFDFVTSLARVAQSYSIICVVPNATPTQITSALKEGVNLISLGRARQQTLETALVPQIADEVRKVGGRGEVLWWVGHDVITGGTALQLRKHSGSGNSAALMHASYADYADVKHLRRRALSTRSSDQSKLFSSLDATFAVGPLLRDRLKDLVPSSTVTMLVPGLSLIDIKHATSRLAAISFGRLDSVNDRVKQGRLAVVAFAQAISRAKKTVGLHSNLFENPTLKVLGMEGASATRTAVLKLAEKEAKRAIDIKLLPYLDERSALRAELDGANLSLFLSWHEGFGLSAWEAIGAGIPLVLSQQTGVYKLLDETGGAAIGCVTRVDIRGSYGIDNTENYQREDVASVRDAIIEVASQLPKKLRDADNLRRLLHFQQGYTWESTTLNFARALGLDCEPVRVGIETGLSRDIEERVELMVSKFDYQSFDAGLDAARNLLRTGRYDSALGELDDLNPEAAPEALAAEYNLLRSEVLLRLNEYPDAERYAQMAAAYFAGAAVWSGKIRADGVINTIFRDRGNYEAAIKVGDQMLALARKSSPRDVGSVQRKLARSLALDGQWASALRAAEEALLLAQQNQSVVDQAKAHLAVAEAHRHGFLQPKAIEAYRLAIDRASIVGDWDCYLWSALGLADSYLLLQMPDEARVILDPVGRLVSARDRRFPIETLHHRLSLCVLDIFEGKKTGAILDELMISYGRLDIRWVESYMRNVTKGNVVVPKRM